MRHRAGSRRQPHRGSERQARGRWSSKLLSAQPADTGRRGLAGGFRIGAERRADVLVAEVVAVAEEDRGALLLREVGREAAQLLVGQGLVDRLEIGNVSRCELLAPASVDRDVARDRQRPRAQVLAVLQARVRAQRAEERLLKRVVRSVTPEQAPQLAEHGISVLFVEALERRDAHGFHHRYKRRPAPWREMWVSGVA